MKVVQVPEIIQEKQWRLSKKLVIAVVSRVTIVPLSDKMQIKYLDTCSYPGETAARKMQRWNEKKFEKCRLKPALLFTISGERPTSTFSTLGVSLSSSTYYRSFSCAFSRYYFFIHTLHIQSPIVVPLQQLPSGNG